MNEDINQSGKTETLSSQDTIEYSIALKSKRNQRRKMISVISLSVSSLLLVFYFTLPTFQCKNIPINGNVNLTKSDIVSLSGSKKYSPLLFLDKKKASENIISSSCGLVIAAEYASNGISANLTIVEDFPHAKIKNDTLKSYFLSGLETSAMMEKLNSLPLSSERIEEIKQNLNKDTEKIPLIHFPTSSFVIDDSSIKSALSSFSFFSYSAISLFSDIQFINDSGDATWNNVCDFALSYNNKWFVLKDCLVDSFDKYFTPKAFPDIIFASLDEKTRDTDNIKTVKYQFKDDCKEIDAYIFKPYFGTEGKVGWSFVSSN